MNEINSAEKIFLGTLERFLQTFDTLDEIAKEIKDIVENEPEKQRQLDLLLSDYYHMLENDDLTDVEILNIGKKIHETRVMRRDENRVSTLIACFEQNKNKLGYSVKANRQMFRQAMSLKRKTLHEDYKYRILTDNDFESLKVDNNAKKCGEVVNKKRRKRGEGITKEQLGECIKQGMRTVDIARKFDVKDPYVSLLKKKYGFNKKD